MVQRMWIHRHIAMVLVCAAAFASPLSRAQELLPFPAYSESDAAYRLGPGDQIEVAIYSAPDLTRVVTIGPDGRIALPMIGAVMAANKTGAELRDALIAAYAPHLRMPEIEVMPRAFASQQVYVGGEVGRPGVYDMTAGMDPLQAVVSAGGFTDRARQNQIIVLSRRPEGGMNVRTFDLSLRAMEQGLPGSAPLGRLDVIYVPRSAIADLNLFMQQYVRDALPIQFGFYYDLRSGN